MSETFHAGDVVFHGAYGQHASVDIVRHVYGGSDADAEEQGYFEVLEFPTPPEGKQKVVYHFFSSRSGHTLFNFDAVEQAANFRITSQIREIIEGKRHEPGYLKGRVERLGERLPWFFCSSLS